MRALSPRRAQYVGGSEVAALFGEHPQLTEFELWHRKAGLLPDEDLSANERVFWGWHLEPAIAAGVADKTGWRINKVHRYLSKDGLGGSLDYEIRANERGPGVLEIKAVDWLVARRWEGEPPLSFELQVQSYLALTGRAWGCLAVLVGGNDLRLFMYDRRPKTIEIIFDRVAAFWASVRSGEPPKPNFETDADTITRLHAAVVGGKVVDIGDNSRAIELVDQYIEAGHAERRAKLERTVAKAELLTIIGDAERALVGNAAISAKIVPGSHIEYDRAEYRDFRINERKARE